MLLFCWTSQKQNQSLPCCVFVSCFQTHENEEDEASDNKDGDRREKEESDVAISFVFGQNIKDRAKVGFLSLVLPYSLGAN